MSRGVLGERIWLADQPGTVAEHHRRPIRILIITATVGGMLFVGGLIWLNVSATLFGLAISILAKLWFVGHPASVLSSVIRWRLERFHKRGDGIA